LLLVRGYAAAFAILLIGLSSGGEVDLLAYLVSRYFGMRHYGKIYGWSLAAFGVGVGSGPMFAGWVRDETGTYIAALDVFAVLVVIAAALIGSLGAPVERTEVRP
jgi:MFS family permease